MFASSADKLASSCPKVSKLQLQYEQEKAELTRDHHWQLESAKKEFQQDKVFHQYNTLLFIKFIRLFHSQSFALCYTVVVTVCVCVGRNYHKT